MIMMVDTNDDVEDDDGGVYIMFATLVESSVVTGCTSNRSQCPPSGKLCHNDHYNYHDGHDDHDYEHDHDNHGAGGLRIF